MVRLPLSKMAGQLLLCGALALCLLCVHASAKETFSFAASPELSKALAEQNSTLEDSWATVLAATLLSSNNGVYCPSTKSTRFTKTYFYFTCKQELSFFCFQKNKR